MRLADIEQMQQFAAQMTGRKHIEEREKKMKNLNDGVPRMKTNSGMPLRLPMLDIDLLHLRVCNDASLPLSLTNHLSLTL